VNLLSSTGVVVSSQTTTSTVNGTGGNALGNPGYYYFSGLPAGDYQIDFVLPGGYTFTQTNTGANTSDSDATQSGVNIGQTGMYTLLAGDNTLTVDAGVVPVVVVPPAPAVIVPNIGGGGSSSVQLSGKPLYQPGNTAMIPISIYDIFPKAQNVIVSPPKSRIPNSKNITKL
jgi:hypothetical protein